MAEKKNKKERKKNTQVVTFNYANKLKNIFTGKEKPYHCQTRDNVMDSTNYIVQTVDQEYHTIEYDLYPKTYCRFDPEPEVTLFDYLSWKYHMIARHIMKARDEDTVWTCPDTNETYSYAEIEKAYLDNLKAINDAIAHIEQEGPIEKGKIK